MKRLVTIPFSHCCEKARWALDYAGMRYVEEKHLPLAHFPAKWARGGRTLPVLVTPHGTLRDSTKIVEWVDRVATPLYPRGDEDRRRTEALVARFDDALGPPVRTLAYWYGLADPRAMRAWVEPGLTTAQRIAFVPWVRAIAPLITRYYALSEASAARAEEAVRGAFAEAGSTLASSAYLSGASFGAADITFSALAASLLLPPHHPSHPEGMAALPPRLRALGESLRATRAGEHALCMYRDRRQAHAAADSSENARASAPAV